MTIKTLIYFTGLLIMFAGFWVGYHAGFVDSESVPFAHQLFFSQDHGALNLLAPILCLGFYSCIGNGLGFLVIALLGTVCGYKIRSQDLNGVTIGLSLVERKTG